MKSLIPLLAVSIMTCASGASALELSEKSPIQYGDLEIVIKPDDNNYKDWLKIGVIEKKASALSSEPTFLYFNQTLIRLPLITNPLFKLSQNGKVLDPLLGLAQGLYVVTLPIHNPYECFDFSVRNRQDREEDFEVCIKVKDTKTAYLGGQSGPYHFRKPFSYWAQSGGSFVSQSVKLDSSSTQAATNSTYAARAGAGLLYKNFEVESFFRAAPASKTFWIQETLGYSFELPSFDLGIKNLVPRILLLGGFESYRNTSSTNTLLIKLYDTPFVGFRSRFIITTRLEIGGDFYYSLIPDVQKYFVQGDMRYWFTNDWALGGGYWIDSAYAKSLKAKETTLAVEALLRYAF